MCITLLIFFLSVNTLLPKDGDGLTSVTIDEDPLLPCHVPVVILIADGHRQGGGHGFGRVAAVAHNDWNEEFFLAFAVKRPQSGQCRCAIEVILEVEVVIVAILGGDGEVKGGAVLRRVPVHSSQEGRGLVQPHYLNKEGEHMGSWLPRNGYFS